MNILNQDENDCHINQDRGGELNLDNFRTITPRNQESQGNENYSTTHLAENLSRNDSIFPPLPIKHRQRQKEEDTSWVDAIRKQHK